MFSHKSHLILGDTPKIDLTNLSKEGIELSNYQLSFRQELDYKGQPSKNVQGGVIRITLPQLPPKDIIEWTLSPSRIYQSGVILVMGEDFMPIDKIIFKNAACVNFDLSYKDFGGSYSSTIMTIVAESLSFGNGLDFDNEWTK